MLIIQLRGSIEPVVGTVNDIVKLTENQKAILAVIEQNHHVTIEELVSIIGKSRRTITRQLLLLKQMNLLRRIGSDKTGSWEIPGDKEV